MTDPQPATVPAAKVRELAGLFGDRAAQCDRLGQLAQSTLIKLSMAGRSEAYEQCRAELLAILTAPEGGERG